MTSIEAFAKKGEKNMLKNMFKEVGASSDDSMSEYGSDDDVAFGSRVGKFTGSESKSSIVLLSPIVSGLTDTDPDYCSGLSTAQAAIADMTDMETSIESYCSVKAAFTISYQQQKKKGIAHQLWPAAVILSKYIEENIQNICGDVGPMGVNVLELGAGVGLCGLVCSALKFRKVILTDLPIAIDLLNTNIHLNSSPNIDLSESQMISDSQITGDYTDFNEAFFDLLFVES